MLRLTFLALFTARVALAQSTPPPAPASSALTLEGVFGLVERVNVNVLISRESIAQSLASVTRERADLLPNLDLQLEQRRTQGVQISGGVPQRNEPTNRFDGVVAGSFNLLSPTQIASYRAARAGAQTARLDYAQTLQSVLATVAENYFAHLRNLQRIQVLDANIMRARALLNLAERQLQVGAITQIDVTRAQAQLATAEQGRLQQDTIVFQSELQLKRLLDLNPGTPLTLANFVVKRTEEQTWAATTEKEAFAQRVDYVRARNVLEQQKELLRAAKLQRLGSVSLFGEYGYASAVAFDGNEKNAWFGGVLLNVPVFDAGRIGADKRSALAQLRSQEFRVRNLEVVISSEVRLAIQDARSRFAQVGVAERSQRLAEDELRLAQIRFERGAADNREVIEAQNRLAIAGDNLVDAVFQYNLSRLELARAKGEVREILKEKAD